MARKFELKTVLLDEDIKDVELVYFDNLISVLKAPADPSKGIDAEQMGQRYDIIKKIKANKGKSIIIEDAEWRIVNQCAKDMKYVGVLSGIMEFNKDIEEAETVETEEKKKK